MMVRRRLSEEPVSRLALWARRFALFSFVASLLSIVIVRSDLLEIQPALATFAAAQMLAVIAILLAFAAFVVIWREGLDGLRYAVAAPFIALALLAYPGYLALQAYSLPAISDGITRTGSAAANGIAPSVTNEAPSSQAGSPALRSASLNSLGRTTLASAIAIGGVMPAAMTTAMMSMLPLARLARPKV